MTGDEDKDASVALGVPRFSAVLAGNKNIQYA